MHRRERSRKTKHMDQATINATAASIDSASSYMAQSNLNKKTREYNDQVYARQRADALSDWNMQNSYNSPASQMQRYRDAGLNPNLIYGQSNEAGVVRSTDSKSWQPQAPRMNAASAGLDRYYQTQMAEAQLSNMHRQNDNLLAQNRLINAQAQLAEAGVPNLESQINLRASQKGKLDTLLPYQAESADWQIRSQMKNLDIVSQRHEYDLLQRSQNLQKGVIEIANKRADLALKNVRTALEQKLIDRTSAEMQIMEIEKARKSIQRDIDQKTYDWYDANGAIKWLNLIFGAVRAVK